MISSNECIKFIDDVLDQVTADLEFRNLLMRPFREVSFEIPIKSSEGNLRVFQGFRVQHNNARGPFKGGVRFNKNVTIEDCRSLATVMTWKTSLLNLPLGGAKGGVSCDPAELDSDELQQITKKYTEKLGSLIGPKIDIPAPDMGTGPREMAWMFEAYSRMNGHEPGVVTGKPVELGGSPLRICSTGYGVAHIVSLYLEELKKDIHFTKVAIHGFGNVGRHTAQFLHKRGAKVVAICDKDGGIFQEDGIDLSSMEENNLTYREYQERNPKVISISPDELLTLKVDILIPASIEGLIGESNMKQINASIIVEGGNIPLTYEAHHYLEDKGIKIVPDILVNGGGVAISYLEWLKSREGNVLRRLDHEEKLKKILHFAFDDVNTRARKDQISYRKAAYLIALERVKVAIELRGH